MLLDAGENATKKLCEENGDSDCYVTPPEPVEFQIDGIPDTIKKLGERFCLLEGRPRKRAPHKWEKIPKRVDSRGELRAAKTNDPTTWMSFEETVKHYKNRWRFRNHGREIIGIGCFLTPEKHKVDEKEYVLVALDFDNCVTPNGESFEIAPAVVELLHKLGSYAELSLSGTGIRAFILVPAEFAAEHRLCSCKGEEFEFYEGSSPRVISITGESLDGYKELKAGTGGVLEAFELAGGIKKLQKEDARKNRQYERAGNLPSWVTADMVTEKIRKNPDHWARFNGENLGSVGDGSQSAAEMSAMNIIVFYTGGDPLLTREVFLMSEHLWREKLEREDYFDGTLQRAVDDCESFYNWETSYSKGVLNVPIMPPSGVSRFRDKAGRDTSAQKLLEIATEGLRKCGIEIGLSADLQYEIRSKPAADRIVSELVYRTGESWAMFRKVCEHLSFAPDGLHALWEKEVWRRSPTCKFFDWGQAVVETTPTIKNNQKVDVPVFAKKAAKGIDPTIQARKFSRAFGAVWVDVDGNPCPKDEFSRQVLRLRSFRDSWYWWFGDKWVLITEQTVLRAIGRFLTNEFSGVSARHKNEVLAVLKGECELRVDGELTSHWMGDGCRERSYLSVANGLIDLLTLETTGEIELRPHSPLWFNLCSIDCRFDPAATCPKAVAFIKDRLDDQYVGLWWEMLGYFLLTDSRYQVLPILFGEAATGKTTALSMIVTLLGVQNLSHVPFEALGERFQTAATLGKMANICEELGDPDKSHEAFVKRYVCGTGIQIEFKGRDGFFASPTAKLIVACNVLPRWKDKSDGIYRRQVVIEFRRQITERIAGMDSPAYWADEREGLLTVALTALRDLLRRGQFDVPESSKELTREHRNDCDLPRAFVTDTLKPADGNAKPIRRVDVNQLATAWMRNNGYRGDLTAKAICGAVRSLFGEDCVPKNGIRIGTRVERVFVGLDLVNLDDRISWDEPEVDDEANISTT